MRTIFISGSTGFVGSNLIDYLKSNYNFSIYNKYNPIQIDQDIVIHLAGKAHDLKKISNPSDYYQVNTELTKEIFDAFLVSNAKVFITLSSVKAVADFVVDELTEECVPNPITHYGKSKLLAEQYIVSKTFPVGKRIYILRPCMIHGPGNKGNLNLLFKFVSNNIPWPLCAFENRRSFCSIDNLIFIINELITREDIPSGIYNVSDDETISTNEIISLIANSKNKRIPIWKIPTWLVRGFARIGDIFSLPLNTERLDKLTQDYIVSNHKIKKVLGKELPITSTNGMIKTLNSFN
jgi:nucleoside-diphosphate-sugar epimerase